MEPSLAGGILSENDNWQARLVIDGHTVAGLTVERSATQEWEVGDSRLPPRAESLYSAGVIRNVLLDWSGTLVDDLPAVWEATNHVFQQAGLPEITLERFRTEFSLPFPDYYRRVLPGIPDDQLEIWFHSYYRQIHHTIRELPHARAFLEFCRQTNRRLFLLTTVPEEHFRVQSGANGFGSYFEATYLGVLDKRRKIHEILGNHGLNPEETVFVGDMQHDVDTAHAGGIHACAVLTGYNRLEQLRASAPDLIVEHLGEFRRLLEHGWPHPSAADPVEHPFPIVTVGGLIFGPDDRVLLVRTHKWSNLWGIPGGKIQRGETAETALRRELLEETNLTVEDIQFALVQDCIDSREFYRPAHFVLLNYVCHSRGKGEVRLNDEAQEHRWVTLTEAEGMELNHPTRVLIRAVHETAMKPAGS